MIRKGDFKAPEKKKTYPCLDGGFKYFFLFNPNPGEMIQFD